MGVNLIILLYAASMIDNTQTLPPLILKPRARHCRQLCFCSFFVSSRSTDINRFPLTPAKQPEYFLKEVLKCLLKKENYFLPVVPMTYVIRH